MSKQIHKPEISPSESIKIFFSQVFAGLAGGLTGTSLALLAIVGIMYTNSIQNLNSNDFSGTTLLIVVFVLSFSANLSALYFLTLVNKKKYKHKKYILQGAFFLNIFLFIIALPFYLLTSNPEFLLTITGIHLFLSASGSALFAEIFAGVKYAVGGTIGVTISQMLLILIYIGIGAPSTNTMVTVLFTPFIWTILPIVIYITEYLYLKLNTNIYK